MSRGIEGASHSSLLNGLFTYGKNAYLNLGSLRPYSAISPITGGPIVRLRTSAWGRVWGLAVFVDLTKLCARATLPFPRYSTTIV
jgi:hypothetical protein